MKAIETIKNFFGLIKIPFIKSIGVKELYQSSSFKEACTRLEIALETEDLALLTGEVGAGKSNVIRFFTHNLDPHDYKIIYIPADKDMTAGELAKQALEKLKMEVPYSSSLAIRRLKNSIIQLNQDKGIKPILIIDEAQELPLRSFLYLKNLINYRMDSANYLFTILCGQKGLPELLDQYPLESLNRRIRNRYELGALTLEETSLYISHQSKICGLDRNIFSDDTKAQIYNHTKGIIGKINGICYNLIIHAASQSKDIIEPSMLEAVIKTLL